MRYLIGILFLFCSVVAIAQPTTPVIVQATMIRLDGRTIDVLDTTMVDDHTHIPSSAAVLKALTWKIDTLDFTNDTLTISLFDDDVPASKVHIDATWLKPEWETGNVAINAGTNELTINHTSSYPLRLVNGSNELALYSNGFDLTSGNDYLGVFNNEFYLGDLTRNVTINPTTFTGTGMTSITLGTPATGSMYVAAGDVVLESSGNSIVIDGAGDRIVFETGTNNESLIIENNGDINTNDNDILDRVGSPGTIGQVFTSQGDNGGALWSDATWLKPELESGDVTINSGFFNDLTLNWAGNSSITLNAAGLKTFDSSGNRLTEISNSGILLEAFDMSTATSYRLNNIDGPSFTYSRLGNIYIDANTDTTGTQGWPLVHDTDGQFRPVDPTTLTVTGDNLGNHTATENLDLFIYKLVGEGGSDGIYVDFDGRVGIKQIPTEAYDFEVNGTGYFDDDLRLGASLLDLSGQPGTFGQVLTSTAAGTSWEDAFSLSGTQYSIPYFNTTSTLAVSPITWDETTLSLTLIDAPYINLAEFTADGIIWGVTESGVGTNFNVTPTNFNITTESFITDADTVRFQKTGGDIAEFSANNYSWDVAQDTTGLDGYVQTFNTTTGKISLTDPASLAVTGDNLGNHTATQDIMAGQQDIDFYGSSSNSGNVGSLRFYEDAGNPWLGTYIKYNNVSNTMSFGWSPGGSDPADDSDVLFINRNNTVSIGASTSDIGALSANLMFKPKNEVNFIQAFNGTNSVFSLDTLGRLTDTVRIQSRLLHLGIPNTNQVDNAYLRMTEGSTYQGGYLHFDGLVNTFHIGVHESSNSSTSSDIEAITIMRNGSGVGIFQPSPSYELDVNGTGNFNGTVRANVHRALTNGSAAAPAYRFLDDNVGFWSGTDVLYVGTGGILAATFEADQDLTLTANLNLDNTTFADQSGIMYKGSNPFIHNFNYGNNGTVTTVGRNVFLGELAGNFTMGSTATVNIFASENVGIGYQSGIALTTGYRNVFIGAFSGGSNTTGHSNMFQGHSAGALNTTGTANIGIGSYSMYNKSTGDHNIAIGNNAGRYIADGVTALTTANQSLYFGSSTKASANSASNEIALGYNVTALGSNTAQIGNTSLDSIGFGTHIYDVSGTPSHGQLFAYDATTDHFELIDLAGSGFGDNLGNHTATQQLDLVSGTEGSPAISFISDGDNGLFLPAANTLGFSVNGAEGMRLTSTGLGIGGNPSYPLDVNGTAAATVLRTTSTGSAAAPTVAINDDNTGFYSTGADVLITTVGGTEVTRWSTTGLSVGGGAPGAELEIGTLSGNGTDFWVLSGTGDGNYANLVFGEGTTVNKYGGIARYSSATTSGTTDPNVISFYGRGIPLMLNTSTTQTDISTSSIYIETTGGTTAGNVGIHNGTPSFPLDVTADSIRLGNYRFDLTGTPSNGQILAWNNLTEHFELASPSGGATNLAFSGASSPVTLTSDTGTDVVFAAGTGITLSQTGNNMTIASSVTNTNLSNTNLTQTADNRIYSFNNYNTYFTNIGSWYMGADNAAFENYTYIDVDGWVANFSESTHLAYMKVNNETDAHGAVQVLTSNTATDDRQALWFENDLTNTRQGFRVHIEEDATAANDKNFYFGDHYGNEGLWITEGSQSANISTHTIYFGVDITNNHVKIGNANVVTDQTLTGTEDEHVLTWDNDTGEASWKANTGGTFPNLENQHFWLGDGSNDAIATQISDLTANGPLRGTDVFMYEAGGVMYKVAFDDFIDDTGLIQADVTLTDLEIPYYDDTSGEWLPSGLVTDGTTVATPNDFQIEGTIWLNSSQTLGIFHGSGDPEGNISADVGSTFHRTDGGSSTSYYVKESGTGNTGWVAK